MRSLNILFIILAVPSLVFANTLIVPTDYPTIQGAIDAAVDGDTVLVKPDTYVENIDFKGKAITVKSEHGPEDTVIDGNQAGSVVTFQSAEGQYSIIEEFTISNGLSTRGGGIICQYGASPTIRRNIISDNTVSYWPYYARGGGIYCAENSSPTIINNVITRNENREHAGGAIHCWFSSPIIIGNIIHSNFADEAAGIEAAYTANIVISNNIIFDNIANDIGGVRFFHTLKSTFTNNLVFRNKAMNRAGGVCCWASPTHVINNLIFDNSSSEGGGICCWQNSSPVITNTILWDNTATEGPEIWIGPTSHPSTLTISHSDLEGGQSSCHVDPGCTLNWGAGMIDDDPLFADPGNDDFHLTWLSPCINRGTNDGAPSEDFDGNPRPYMGTVDMGADEFVGTHPLAADLFTVSEVAGGTVDFTLTGGMDNNGRGYIVFGGVTGTAPGTTLPGGLETLRLNWDVFTDFVIALISTPLFTDFLGTLDTSGTATAQLNVPQVPGFAGVTMHYAYALNIPWDFVSNPVAIEIVP